MNEARPQEPVSSRAEGKLARVRRRALKAARQLVDLTFDSRLSQSYWPEESHKSRARIFGELLWWFARHREINNYYYVYGLDRRSRDRTSELLPYRTFRQIRNRENLRAGKAPWNYVCVLRDKFLFAQLASSLGVATPKAYALLDAQSVQWLDEDQRAPLDSLWTSGRTLDAFCKKLDGIQGEGAFPLRIDNGRVSIKDRAVEVDELRAQVSGRYLLQQRVEQHPAMRALHPSSLNTVRLITFCRNGRASLFSAAVRIGARGKSVDNWAAGGLIVGVDPERGVLRGEGFFKPGYGGRALLHPDTGVQFDGYPIPFFREAVQLVTRMHEYLRDVHSIGWDVGISPDGPVLIEGNDDWEGGIPMVLERDFRRRFLSMYQREAERASWTAGELALKH